MIQGSCHCKTVTWVFENTLESVTACNCNLCRRYGALWAYGQLGEGIKVSGPTKAYSHAKKYSGFHFCENCGCLAYYLARTPDAEGKLKVAVNVRMADAPEQIENLPIDHFDGLNKFEDEPRDGRLIKHLWY